MKTFNPTHFPTGHPSNYPDVMMGRRKCVNKKINEQKGTAGGMKEEKKNCQSV